MVYFFRIVRNTAREVWGENFAALTQFQYVVEFFVIWAVISFISLVVAPLILVLILVLLPFHWFSLIFPKTKQPNPIEVVSYPLKEKYRDKH